MYSMGSNVTMSVTNIKEKNKSYVNTILSFPLESISLPKDTVSVVITEYGRYPGYDVMKNINAYVGEEMTVGDLHKKDAFRIEKSALDYIESINDRIVCYEDKNGLKVAFVRPNEEDFVFETVEDLENYIMLLSNKYDGITKGLEEFRILFNKNEQKEKGKPFIKRRNEVDNK